MQKCPPPAERVPRRRAGLALLGLLLLAPLGCHTVHVNQKPPFTYDYAGLPHTQKRIEASPELDYVTHWTRKAYVRPSEHLHGAPDPRFQLVLEQWGTPDWIRKTFTSLEGDRVDEWIYLDQARLFQFIGDTLVYEGPLTDYEQTLLRRGYPDTSITVQTAEGWRSDTFIYNHLFMPRLEQYKFVDGMIVNSKEGF